MKLINKTILYYLLVTLPLLAVSGYISLILIGNEVSDATDEELWKSKINAEKFIQLNSPTTITYFNIDSSSFCKPIAVPKSGFIYSDTVMYDSVEEENLNYRFLNSFITNGKLSYQITVFKTTVEKDDLTESLVSSFALGFSLLVFGFLMVNLMLTRLLWKPFHNTLEKLDQFEINKSIT